MSGSGHTTAYIGLGSNLEVPDAQVARALTELAKLGPLRASSLYRSEPLGASNQPWYVNAVAELGTDLAPAELLAELLAQERRAGRPAARPRWVSRVLDLDLLLMGDLVLDTPDLTLPHPGLARRRFVLEPLCELAPTLVEPRSGKTVRQLLETLDDPLRVEKHPPRPPEGPAP